MDPFILSVLLALLGTSLFNVGMGMQKPGAPLLSRLGSALRQSQGRQLLALWVVGVVFTVVAVVLSYKALDYGPASVVGAVNGFGLVALTLFSAVALKEKVGRAEIAGMLAIVAGVGTVGYFGAQAHEGPPRVDLHALLLGSAALLGVPGVALALSGWRSIRPRGLALGALAGAFSGIGIVVMDVATTGFYNWWLCFFVWLTVSIASFVLTQVAYRFGRAIEVVPTFMSASIIAPVVLGPLGLGDVLTPMMGLGVVAILAGVVVLGTSSDHEP
ncbi:MAG TPA: EamA family transporter [Candidatus Nitrosotenuis sp.]|nr:EamA family transporter [Candidatus Nitrosotenuis sp.]